MYFVYYGYVVPGHYEIANGPVYSIETCATEAEVISFKAAFMETIDSDCQDVAFRVFAGRERQVVPKKVVKTYQLL